MSEIDNSSTESSSVRLDSHTRNSALKYAGKLGITSVSGAVRVAMTAIENLESPEEQFARLSQMQMQLSEISRHLKQKTSIPAADLDVLVAQMQEVLTRMQVLESRVPDPDYIHPLVREQLKEIVRGLEHLAYVLKVDELVPPVEDYME